MDSPDFYAIVRRELGPWLKRSGFRRPVARRDLGLSVHPRAGAWVKPLPDRGRPPVPDRLVVTVEHGPSTWNRWYGGQLVITLEAWETAAFHHLVDEEQGLALADLTMAVVRRIAAQPGSRMEVPEVEWRVRSEQPPEVLCYWDERDVAAYLALVRPWIPRLVARLGNDPFLVRQFAAP